MIALRADGASIFKANVNNQCLSDAARFAAQRVPPERASSRDLPAVHPSALRCRRRAGLYSVPLARMPAMALRCAVHLSAVNLHLVPAGE